MSLSEKLPVIAVTAVLAGGVAVMVSNVVSGPERVVPSEVTVPALSAQAKTGEAAFGANCAACHGQNASGGDSGPPLVHDIYNPGHHADVSFFMAAKNGVRRHHWQYGDMPPQPDVSDKKMADIIRYVRELQAANGIVYRPHNM